MLEHHEVVGGRYQVERLLGEGGMGTVHAVRELSTSRRMALKRLHPASRQEALFEQEYRTLAGLRHPGIVEVFEYGRDETGAFYTMELLEGSDLSKLAPMPWRQVCVCMREIASTLGILHARRIVHRDLNPRNVWRTTSGALKLLDFGALSPFGVASDIVGVPSLVAPEAIKGESLGPCADLYALGALCYWLLTGSHAYRAPTFRDLQRAWSEPCFPPSAQLLRSHAKENDYPPEVDELIASMLRLDRNERPQSTAEVVDRLNAIMGLSHEVDVAALRGYLDSGSFVGRHVEREVFVTELRAATDGSPQALLIEGREGIGKTRLLAEFATIGRIAGVTVMSVAADGGKRPYHHATALARSLLVALPQVASSAAAPYAAALAPLLPELGLSLDRGSHHSEPTASADRARKQQALNAWVLAIARQTPLVILVDDVDLVDEESQALYASLARTSPGHRLTLVASVNPDSPGAHTPTLRALSSVARALVLDALSPAELGELLQSIFGRVPYLDRVAARLYEVSEGSPSHALMLARHLLQTGSVRYADGVFTLPAQLPDQLPRTLQSCVLTALEELRGAAREIAQIASVPDHCPMQRDTLAELCGTSKESLERSLALLLARRVLVETSEGLRVAHPSVREQLWSEVSAHERARVHRHLAAALEGSEDAFASTRQALHLLRANMMKRGERILLDAARRTHADSGCLRLVAPLFEEACELLRAAGRREAALVAPLSVLAMAGYLVDRGYAERQGDAAVQTMQRVLRFDLARRLRSYLGGRLALLLALGVSLLTLSWQRSSLRVLEVVTWFISSVGSLTGTAATCVDAARCRRYAEAMVPLLALGPDHAATLLHGFCMAQADGSVERQWECQQRLLAFIARLRSPAPIRGMPADYRTHFLTGAQFSFGVRRTFACDETVLQVADTIAAIDPLKSMQASHLRAQYYLGRGSYELAKRYAKEVELQAIQLGTAWQAELWSIPSRMRLALWTHDLALSKQTLQELEHLSRELPTLKAYLNQTQATHWLLLGKHKEARRLLEHSPSGPPRVGLASQQALLARLLNLEGEHARARDLCQGVLSSLPPTEYQFVTLTLNIHVELAIAEAGMGESVAATRRLGALLTAHAAKGPLVAGWLHRALANVALLAGDLASAGRQLLSMEEFYRATGVPSLMKLSSELRLALTNAGRAPTEISTNRQVEQISSVLARRHSSGADPELQLSEALSLVVEASGGDHGFLMLAASNGVVAKQGAPPSAEALHWASHSVSTCIEDEGRTPSSSVADELVTQDFELVDGAYYSLFRLWHLEGVAERVVGALVISSTIAPPRLLLPCRVLELLAARLAAVAAMQGQSAADVTRPVVRRSLRSGPFRDSPGKAKL